MTEEHGDKAAIRGIEPKAPTKFSLHGFTIRGPKRAAVVDVPRRPKRIPPRRVIGTGIDLTPRRKQRFAPPQPGSSMAFVDERARERVPVAPRAEVHGPEGWLAWFHRNGVDVEPSTDKRTVQGIGSAASVEVRQELDRQGPMLAAHFRKEIYPCTAGPHKTPVQAAEIVPGGTATCLEHLKARR